MEAMRMSPSDAMVPPDDWRTLLRTRANVLVTGPQEALTAFVRAARSELIEPIRSVVCSSP